MAPFGEMHDGLKVLFAFSFWFLCSLYLLCWVFVKIVWLRLKEGERGGEGVSKCNDERWRHKREVIFYGARGLNRGVQDP